MNKESAEQSVVGYVIQNAAGDYLANQLYWYHHDKAEEAFVHPADRLDEINWKMSAAKEKFLPGHIWLPPQTMTPATWIPNKGVIITGAAEPFPWESTPRGIRILVRFAPYSNVALVRAEGVTEPPCWAVSPDWGVRDEHAPQMFNAHVDPAGEDVKMHDEHPFPRVLRELQLRIAGIYPPELATPGKPERDDFPDCPNPDCTQSGRVAINHIGGGEAHGGQKYYCYGCGTTFS